MVMYVFCVEFGFLDTYYYDCTVLVLEYNHSVIYNTVIQPLTFLPMRLSRLNLLILIKSLVKKCI